MAVRLRDNANKLLNIMEEYGLDDRVIDDNWDLTRIFSKKVDWNAVNEQVEWRRATSKDYLKRMIEL